MENRFETMLDHYFDHGFAVDWMRKDLKICLEASDQIGASLPVTALVNEFYKDVQKMGGGRWDTSSLSQTSQFRKIDIEINSKFTIVIGCRYSLLLTSWQRYCFVIVKNSRVFLGCSILLGPVELVDSYIAFKPF